MSVMQSSMINDANADLKATMSMKAPQTGLMVPSIQMEKGTKPTVTASNAQLAPALLLELVTIVTQIAQLDSMFATVKEGAPAAGSEADKWHQVSVQALECSRKYMVEQQTSLLQRLATATGTPLKAQSDNSASETQKAQIKNAAFEIQKENAAAEQMAIAPPPGLEIHASHEEHPNASATDIPGETEGNSLRTDLEKIKLHSPGCALLVRKIKPLGFESPEHLRAHCEQFGKVAEVLVSHCITKPSPKRAKGRVRPAALGFVVMASSEDADAVFANGEQQTISFHDGGVTVEVQRFRDVAEGSLF